MYLDAELLFSHNQAITASCASAKTLDLGSCQGNGMPVFPLVQIVQGFQAATSLTVHVQSCNKADIAGETPTESDWQTILSSQKMGADKLAKPCTIAFGCLPANAGNFLRVYYEVEGTATAGAVTAALVLNMQG